MVGLVRRTANKSESEPPSPTISTKSAGCAAHADCSLLAGKSRCSTRPWFAPSLLHEYAPDCTLQSLGRDAQGRRLTEFHSIYDAVLLLRLLHLDDVDGIRVRIERHNYGHVLVFFTLESVWIVDFVFLAVGVVLEALAVMAHGT